MDRQQTGRDILTGTNDTKLDWPFIIMAQLVKIMISPSLTAMKLHELGRTYDVRSQTDFASF